MTSNDKVTERPVYIVEISVEVCYKIGGIHTVISSKAAAMKESWGDNYLLIGPYLPINYEGVFKPISKPDGLFGEVLLKLKERGIDAHYGFWLIDGLPNVILINPYTAVDTENHYINNYLKHHSLPYYNINLDLIFSFSYLIDVFFKEVIHLSKGNIDFIAHFHEYASAAVIPEIKRQKLSIFTVFTTHATIIGRYLSNRDEAFDMSIYNWEKESKTTDPEHIFLIHLERLIAKSTDIFTTVSEQMIPECLKMLGRNPDMITPNGLNTDIGQINKLNKDISKNIFNECVKTHFFDFYKFDLEDTFFFFTAGRYEFINKGYDIIISALGLLNFEMKRQKLKKTVVMLFITDSIGLENNGRVQMGSSSYYDQRKKRPGIVVESQVSIDHFEDEIIKNLIFEELYNNETDKVKVMYHPAFVSEKDTFVSNTYPQLIKGFDLGIFPSKYEPWGYTPHECAAYGIPTVLSDASGFGQFVMRNIANFKDYGLMILNRKKSKIQIVNELSCHLLNFVKNDCRVLSKETELKAILECSDWRHLIHFYNKAYEIVLKIEK